MRRALASIILLLVLGGIILAYIHRTSPDWYLRAQYPLEYEEMIVASSQHNGIDPALVAAVINQESDFIADSTSQAGARGLMQLMPDTADWIARKTGGNEFTIDDLYDPGINISYGCWYLAYLLDQYDGSVMLALAAYNGGAENVDDWMSAAEAAGREFDSARDIPYEETRDYVNEVDEGRKAYAEAYAPELRL